MLLCVLRSSCSPTASTCQQVKNFICIFFHDSNMAVMSFSDKMYFTVMYIVSGNEMLFKSPSPTQMILQQDFNIFKCLPPLYAENIL